MDADEFEVLDSERGPIDDPETARKWPHRRGDEYVLIVASIVGNDNTGFRTERWLGSARRFDAIPEAQREGFRSLDRSDDFNIGAIRRGLLMAVLWMDEIVDDGHDVLQRVGEQIGIASAGLGLLEDETGRPNNTTKG